jgi:hypothetical protein
VQARVQQRAGHRDAECLAHLTAGGRDARGQASLARWHGRDRGVADLAVDHAQADAEQRERRDEVELPGGHGEPGHRDHAQH